MEPHKDLPPGAEAFRPSFHNGPRAYYEKAMAFARKFYSDEVDRISSVKFDKVSPGFFFNEYVWVVHATGFRASVVGKMMPRLDEAYGEWSFLGTEAVGTVVDRVKAVCNNPGKINAVHSTAKLMCKELVGERKPWSDFKSERLSSPELLSKLPYIGPITSYHLGRNLGLLDCVKPDLHLVRMAEHWGFRDCVEMCESMRGGDDVPLGIVDLALWYAASTFGTLEIKKDGSR